MKLFQATVFFPKGTPTRNVLCRSSLPVVATAVLVLLGLFLGSVARGEKSEESQVAKDRFENADVPVKWLPDLKVLVNAPTTTINLNDAVRQLCDDGRLGDPSTISPDDVELSIVSGESDYANLSIEGSELVVSWNPGAVGSSMIVVKATKKGNEAEHAYISFRAESWTPDYLMVLMIVVGGGGLFLLGMKRMSEGLQAIAGRKLQRMINLFTNHRVFALGIGAFVTALVQSSTATSVMTLGFVNSGVMTLKQAIGVLMGANIGTTTTGWLFTLNIGQYGLPTLGVAAIFYLFCKNEKVRNFSIFFLGLGMIFFGLETLKIGLTPLSDSPHFTAFMNTFRANSIFGAVMCVVVGCVATALTHSSAAILAITITLASLGSLDLNSSAAITLGSNIGTSLTPMLVAIGAPCTTRRAAYFHFVFNTVGVVWVMAIFFPIFVPCVNMLGTAFHLSISGKIALTHTVFNVANTIVFLPLVDPISRILEKYVVDKKKTRKSSAFPTTHLSASLLSVPKSAISQANVVVEDAFADCVKLTESLKTLFDEKFQDRQRVDAAFEIEDKLDSVQDETILFLSQLYSKTLPKGDIRQVQRQTRVVQELEKVSDYLVSILKSFLKLGDSELQSPEILNKIFSENEKNVVDALKWLGDAFKNGPSPSLKEEMYKRRARYVAAAKAERDQYVNLMYSESFDPNVIVAIDAQLTFWRRIYEHLVNIAEATTID